jgi:hypothetical protein
MQGETFSSTLNERASWGQAEIGEEIFVCVRERERVQRGKNVGTGTINNKSIAHNCAGRVCSIPLLRHHHNFTTNKAIVPKALQPSNRNVNTRRKIGLR